MSHADSQWRNLNRALDDIIGEFVPAGEKDGIVLHAKDIFHGTKRFHRDRWPLAKRVELLRCISKLPDMMSLPVVLGAIDKSQYSWGPQTDNVAQFEANSYSLAFGLCATHVEYFMRSHLSDEVAALVVEDVPNMRRYAQLGYKILTDATLPWQQADDVFNYMPFERIIEQPLFAEKKDSSILQIADTIAFVAGRLLNGGDNVREFFDLFEAQIVLLPHQSR